MHSLCRILFLCAILTSLLFIHVTKAGAILAALEHETVNKENCNPPGAVCSNDPPCCNPRCRIYWLAKMSTRLWLIVLLLCSVFIYDCSCFLFSPLTASLTEVECKQYFTSNDLNKIIQAFHKCPKRYRPSYN
ncbi:unnamed protein product [Rotaria socialis]|uniref:Uncharacterized protein n=1 Tax=Rotaria socialis TaxID=392032 RepID=A0A817YHN7_9BILA|nr:unnamed protein product [Rotaria socialis]